MKVMVLMPGAARREGCTGTTSRTPVELRHRLRLWGFCMTKELLSFTNRQAYPLHTVVRNYQDNVELLRPYRYRWDWKTLLYRMEYTSQRRQRKTTIINREDLV